MKKSKKGEQIMLIKINTSDGFIEAITTSFDTLKLTREQRSVIMKNYKLPNEEFKQVLIKTFNNPKIVNDDFHVDVN